MESKEITDRLQKLRDPFAAHQVSTMCRSTKKDNPKGTCPKCRGYHGLPAIQLDYVGHAALTDRLLDVDPAWNWEPLAFDEKGMPARDRDGGMWIRLTVCGVTRLGYGDADGKTGPNATKELIGDALRNAAMRFGCALDLWHKGVLHMDTDQDGDPGEEQATKPDSVGLANAVQAIKNATTVEDIAKHLKAGAALYPDHTTALQKHATERKAQLSKQQEKAA